MDAQIVNHNSAIDDVERRRGRHYPTRSDHIIHMQDREDWMRVAYNIITRNNTKPRNIHMLLNQHGTTRIDLLHNKTVVGGRRSLWNILVGLINSYNNKKESMPSADDIDRILRTMENLYSGAQTPATVSLDMALKVQTALAAPPQFILSGPVIAHLDRRRTEIKGVLDDSDPTRTEIRTDDIPDTSHFAGLTKGQKVIFLAYYGYRGTPHDPTNKESYDRMLRQSINDIAQALNKSYSAVYQQLWIAQRKISELSGETRSMDEISRVGVPAPTDAPSHTPALPGTRKIPTPIPKRVSTTPLNYSGETAPSPSWGVRVTRAPQPIPQQFSPSPPHHNGKKKTGIVPGVLKFPKFRETPAEDLSFQELVHQSPEAHIIGRVPVPEPATVVIEKQPRYIPEFSSYREALLWANAQSDWMGIMEQRTRTNPLYKDDMALRAWLQQQGISEIIPLLGQMKSLYGARISFNTLMDQILAPLPEEKITLEDIQRNPQWMRMIEEAFAQHKAKNYGGCMSAVQKVLLDDQLGEGLYTLMEEYGENNYMNVFALITHIPWTEEDAAHYSYRKLSDVLNCTVGHSSPVRRIWDMGSHVSFSDLSRELQDIKVKIPLGEMQWQRFKEYDCPEQTLYDVVVGVVKGSYNYKKGDEKSPKKLFYQFEEMVMIGM